MKLPKDLISCRVIDLGLVDYKQAYDFQQKVLGERIKGFCFDTLILCEHSPVITLGRLARINNILAEKATLNSLGVETISVNRGGDITFHGPGQLVAYPIFNLANHRKDLRDFLNKLEQVAIELLKHFDCFAYSREGFRGAWVGDRKIASIGIGVKKWVSFHGLAININTNLDFFSLIKPCGLDVAMTSLAKESNSKIDINTAKSILIDKFKSIFGLQLEIAYPSSSANEAMADFGACPAVRRGCSQKGKAKNLSADNSTKLIVKAA